MMPSTESLGAGLFDAVGSALLLTIAWAGAQDRRQPSQPTPVKATEVISISSPDPATKPTAPTT